MIRSAGSVVAGNFCYRQLLTSFQALQTKKHPWCRLGIQFPRTHTRLVSTQNQIQLKNIKVKHHTSSQNIYRLLYTEIMRINPAIFRAYDIRGTVDKDLTPDVYYHLGRAYATFLTNRHLFLCPVGCDNRPNSQEYKTSFINGLVDGGVNVADLGQTLSPMLYFSSYALLTRAGAMITASHNPPTDNGLKLITGYSESIGTADIQKIRSLTENEAYSKGKGKIVTIDLFPLYQKDVSKYFSLSQKWRVVVDASHTNSGLFYPPILKQNGCEVIEKNCQPNSLYPLGTPDPTRIEVMDRLSQAVLAEKADLGFAYDGDGDRLAVVDEKGQKIWMDQIIALFAKEQLDSIPGSPIVFNNLCSKTVSDTIRQLGGHPFIWKTGRSFIKTKANEKQALFAGEFSGHLFFMDNFYGYDDAVYASLRLLAYLERKGLSLSAAIADLPKYHSSPEIKLSLNLPRNSESVHETLRKELSLLLPLGEISDLDGIRIETFDSMIVVRSSQNGPYLTLRFESKTASGYNHLKNKLAELFRKHPEINLQTSTNTDSLFAP